MPTELIFTALLLGLASSGHCIFMCGGISCALSQQSDSSQKKSLLNNSLRLLLFHLGRISCYAFLGLIFGLFIQLLNPDAPIFSTILRHIAALLIIAMGLYISGLNNTLKKIEAKLGFIWKKLQPISSKLMQSHGTATRFALGFVWGFLPCGMIYSTVLWASTAANSSASTYGAISTALLMFIFGLGTLPSLLILNLASLKAGEKISRFFRLKNSKKAIGFLLILFGVWSLLAIYLPMPSILHNMPTSEQGGDEAMHHHHH
ncbi:MAG: sulfite exporter TauE/SafE family protein [Pseudomonadales bacterium]|nr:sulfite exporter TauE/SafE family protein [Pseudomonadales bacterium]